MNTYRYVQTRTQRICCIWEHFEGKAWKEVTQGWCPLQVQMKLLQVCSVAEEEELKGGHHVRAVQTNPLTRFILILERSKINFWDL